MNPNYSTKRIDGRPPAPEDTQLFAHIERNLYTAVISDALDEVGIRDRAMYEQLQPINPDSVFAGWARTVSCVDMYHIPDDPYALEIEALDSVLPGEVLVIGTCESKRNAPGRPSSFQDAYTSLAT